MTRVFCLVLIIFLSSINTLWGDGSRYAQNSVLSEGRWVKIKVDTTGIYKLTAADVKKMGFSDISKVGVFGYGCWMLDEDFSKNTYIDDLPEVATWKGDGDFILFYGKGPIRWTLSGREFIHEQNPYSTAGYYFLRETASPKRMETKANPAEAARRVTAFDDYALHELESRSVIKSGRDLFGEDFTAKNSRDFTFKVPGITGDDAKVTYRFISKATGSPGTVTMSVNGNTFPASTIRTDNDDYTAAVDVKSSHDWKGEKSEDVKVNITYDGASSHRNVHLDYIRLQMKRGLRPYGAVTLFREIDSRDNSSRFVVQGGNSNLIVMDVTEGETHSVMQTSLSGEELSFTAPANGKLREFVLVQPNGTIPSPEFVGEVKTQNLHGLPQAGMVIIAPAAFTIQAERLAEEHRKRDGLTVHVVDPQQIYNEFSSGTPDATAYRRFMKMFYDRSNSEADAPRYLLLFGDGAYDNRQLTTEWKAVDMGNFLLTYQSVNSIMSGVRSGTYVTDDYFGLLEDNQGNDIQFANLNLGIGRFPVRSAAQAKNAVDKVIAYMNNKEYGPWKNTVCFVADDGNQQDSFTLEHMTKADQLAVITTSLMPELMVKKLYFDAHKKDNSSGGFATYPTIKSGLLQQLKDGVLLVNYTGHGSIDSWSDEKVLVQADINQFSYKRLPVWITATCDFTPFDEVVTSAGEDVFLNAQSGGIALFTTMRVAYRQTNEPINRSLIRHLFQQENGKYPTLGEVIQKMKNGATISDGFDLRHQKLNFILIGDPALRMNYPTAEIQVTEINGNPVTDEILTFSALQKVKVKGIILNPDGSRNTGFNGEIQPTVFDSQVTITTLDNNKTGKKMEFTDFPGKIYIGNDEVKNGEFEFSFTVPIDISYTNDFGNMSLYAVDKSTGEEAKGSFRNYTVGGTGGSIDDKDGPEIRAIYLNDSTFTDGGVVNSTPLLAARLWDASGINVTGSSIGHDITLVIDGQSALTYNLNPYYKTIPGTDGEGLIHFLIPELPAGRHTAELKVWDVLNNATTDTISFEVAEGLKPKLYEIWAAPTPAREEVTFYLYHNRPESKVKVSILVYDMTGRLQWKGEEQGTSGLNEPLTVRWNLQNGAGSRLRPGVYIYRAAISTDKSKEATDAKKLIILAQ